MLLSSYSNFASSFIGYGPRLKCVQEMMRAIQCFFSEFWDFTDERKPVNMTDDPEAQAALLKQPTGWCIAMLKNTRICHLRGYGFQCNPILSLLSKGCGVALLALPGQQYKFKVVK